MKIAFINSSTGWGGLEMNTLKLAKSLTAKGYHITLITQENSTIYTKGKSFFDAIILLHKRRKFFDFASARKISQALKKQEIETLLIFDNKDLDVVAWTRKLFYNKLHVLYQQHMQIGINKKDLLHTFRYKVITYWISPLQYLKEEVVVRTKFPADKIKVIPIGVEVSAFTKRKYTKQQALEILGIAPKAPLIGIIGRVSRNKGQLFLVNALLNLRKKGIETELLIFGSATINDPECQLYYQEIKEVIKQQGLEGRVHLVDYREDVALFYNAIDVFVLASHSETYGMVTIEAMLSMLPIIATKSGGTSEILDYGKLGQLYAYGNEDDYSRKVAWHLNHKTQSAEMAARAQQTAIEKYALEKEVNGIEKLLRAVSGRT